MKCHNPLTSFLPWTFVCTPIQPRSLPLCFATTLAQNSRQVLDLRYGTFARRLNTQKDEKWREEEGGKYKSKAPANATTTPLAWSTTSCLHFVALRGFWIADHVVKTLELRLGFCLRGPASNGGGLRGASALCGFGIGKGGMLAFIFGGRGGGEGGEWWKRSEAEEDKP